jgi:hypothetical protein
MDRLTTILIIAQNGLKTAASILISNAKKLDGQSAKATDPKEAARLKKKADKSRKLANVLNSADVGITNYMNDADAQS